MPRPRRKPSATKKATRSSSSSERDQLLARMNSHRSLERMLESVLLPTEEVERPQEEQDPVSEVAAPMAVSQLVEEERIHAADRTLVENVQRRSRLPKRIQIQMGSHEPSPHQTRIAYRVSRVKSGEREPIMASVGDWSAPFEEPPSLDALEALASDLCVAVVDPHAFMHQFTPATADLAWAERYAWWRQVRAPFIRWVAAKPISRNPYPVTTKGRSFLGRLLHRADEAAMELHEKEEEAIVGMEEAWGVPVMVPRLDPVRVLIGFAVLFVVVSLPAAAVSFGHSLNRSWSEVHSAGEAVASGIDGTLATAVPTSAALSDVASRLRRADQALGQVSALAVALAETLPSTRNQYTTVRSLIRAGELSAQAAALLRQGIDRALTAEVRYPVERLDTFRTYLDAAAPLVDEAAGLAAGTNPNHVPEGFRSSVGELAETLAGAQTIVRETDAITELLGFMVGKQEPRTYLFVFQNNAELRPTGGFMGSIAEVVLDRGEVKRIRVPGGGPYDLRSELREHVAPPKPLQLIASRWEFQDANWFPDFAAAADKIRWFWSRSGQPTVDGVVTVNATVLEKLIGFTGPISLPAYDKVLTEENVLSELQKAVELEYDPTENAPKKIIGDTLEEMLKRIRTIPPERAPELLAVLADALRSKEIQLWLTRPEEQERVARFGWTGRLAATTGDALAVVEANIAGQKTDTSIDETVHHAVAIAEDGTITDTVTLTRTHRGQKGELFRGVNNVSYVRFYVPDGSELLAAEGFNPPSPSLFKPVPPEEGQDPHLASLIQDEGQDPHGLDVTKEFGRMAFGGWVQLEPGVTSVTKIQYRLPMTAFDMTRRLNPADGTSTGRPSYLGLFTSQSGKGTRSVEVSVTYPEAWKIAWQSPEPASWSTLWDRDRVFAMLFDLPNEERR